MGKFVFIFCCLAALMPISAPGAAKSWTVMVYMDADNDLEKFIVDDFVEMAEIGSDDNVNIVVQLDRVPLSVLAAVNQSGYDDTRYGDWSTCHRFYIEKDMEPVESSAVSDWGDGSGGREVDMGDGATLKSFMNWAVENHPAEKYALILEDHGGGWRSRKARLEQSLRRAESPTEKARLESMIEDLKHYRALCWDETNDGTPLYSAELAEAVLGADCNLDLLGFDACLMGMIEVANEMTALTEIIVASEQSEPGYGWYYKDIFSYLNANPDASASDLGEKIVEVYDSFYAKIESDYTLAALDVMEVGTLTQTIDELARSLIDDWDNDPDAVGQKALAVKKQLKKAVLAEAHGADWKNKAYGLSINFPEDGPEAAYTSTNLDFLSETKWRDFLSEYSSEMGGSWVEDARKPLKTFGGATDYYIDIYSFCDALGGSTEDYLAYGSILSLTPDEVHSSLNEFDKYPQLWVGYSDPVKSQDKKAKLKIIAKSTSGSSYYAEFKKNIRLYDKKEYKTVTASQLLGSKKINDYEADGLYAKLKDKKNGIDVDDELLDGRKVYFAAPVIDDVAGTPETGETLVVKGKYFGAKPPKVTIECQKDGKYKYKKCKLLKDETMRFMDAKRKTAKSCMRIWEDDGVGEVGYSEVSVEYPKISDKYTVTGYLCLANNAGLTAFQLDEYYSISGAVSDADGDGVKGVTVSTGEKSTTTDTDGSYTISGLSDGDYTVSPTADGYSFSPSSQSVTIAGANQTGVDFTGTEGGGGGDGGTVSGMVIGDYTADIWMSIDEDPYEDGAYYDSLTLNGAGSYSFDNVPDGNYIVSINYYDNDHYSCVPETWKHTVTVNGASVAGVDFTLSYHAIDIEGIWSSNRGTMYIYQDNWSVNGTFGDDGSFQGALTDIGDKIDRLDGTWATSTASGTMELYFGHGEYSGFTFGGDYIFEGSSYEYDWDGQWSDHLYSE